MRVAVGNDVAGQHRAEAGHAGQQRRRRRVEIDTDAVHAILDHGVEFAAQGRLVDVMLILPDADRLGIDLDQLGQRILQAARDRDGATHGDVQIGEFLRRRFRGGIDRRARFRHHDAGQFQLGMFGDDVRHEFVGLARPGAIADRHQLDRKFTGQRGDFQHRACPIVARHMGIDDAGMHHLAGAVDHRQLDAGAQPRIEAQSRPHARRRSQQEAGHIAAEHSDRLRLRRFAQPRHQLQLQMQMDLDAPSPAHGVGKPAIGRTALIHNEEASGDHLLAQGHDLAVVRGVGRL